MPFVKTSHIWKPDRRTILRRTCLLILLLLMTGVSSAEGQTKAGTAPTAAITKGDSLGGLQEQLKILAPKLQTAIVSVRGSSGVIISEDGIILSQDHVSHAQKGRGLPGHEKLKPGTEVDVITFDGKRKKARLLGSDEVLDISLLKLVEPGPYPYVPIRKDVKPKLGDWVLEFGHPGGYKEGRLPVVRLGRVLMIGNVRGVTDCLSQGGDSGGPYFDLSGDLIGIVANDHVPDVLKHSGGIKGVFYMSFTPVGAIAARLAEMRGGTVIKGGQAAYQKLVEPEYANAKSLPPDQWTQGASNVSKWNASDSKLRAGVVDVVDNGRVLALGTVVDSDGWVVTKASQITQQPTVRGSSGKLLAAQIVGVHPAFDIALLKVKGLESVPLDWTEVQTAPTGTLVVAPSRTGVPIATGMVSVKRRDIPGPHPTEVVMAELPKGTALPPEVIGSPVYGRGYWIDYVEGNAKKGGLQLGDLLISIAGYPIRHHVDLLKSVTHLDGGQETVCQIQRVGRKLELSVTLPAKKEKYVYRSARISGFPTIFECDVPLLLNECGGPLVGIDGKVLGVSLARLGPYGSAAVPADLLRALIIELKRGKPRGSLPDRVAPVEGKDASISTEALKDILKQRAETIESLIVEYDVTSEAHVEPELLVAWGMLQTRDYSERHIVGFSGRKQLAHLERPDFQVNHAPLDQIGPAANAPDDVKARVEGYRRTMAARKTSGLLDHLWRAAPPIYRDHRCFFDGKNCFLGDSAARMLPAGLETFNSPGMYLTNLMISPLPPGIPDTLRDVQRMLRQPDAFEFYRQTKILSKTQKVDGADCIVLEAEWEWKRLGKAVAMKDRILFDPSLGYAPRRWEQYWDGHLQNVRVNEDFAQYSKGYWLPRHCTWTRQAPDWVDEAHRNRPAYSYRMRLLRAQCGEEAKEFFSKEAAAQK